MGVGHQRTGALEVLQRASGPAGILASTEERANYRRIWTRDAVVCGLGGVAAADEGVLAAMERSLDRLTGALGPHGEVPSNVAASGPAAPSYGRLAGRVDAGSWLAIGAAHLPARRERFAAAVEGVFALHERWELNAGGLLYSPLGGGWADEYPLHGYTLTEQLLRIWALRLWGRRDRAAAIQAIVETNFWTGPEAAAADRIHPVAYRRARAAGGTARHFAAALSPAGYAPELDALANSLAILLGLGTAAQRASAAETICAALEEAGGELAPAFWPPIAAGDPRYDELEGMRTGELRNHPGEYHNGGLWPMVNGFVAAALRALGDGAGADRLAEAIARANRRSPSGNAGDDFYEFHSAGSLEPGGVRRCTWSAAGELIAAGAPLDYGSGR
jgi:hypothetical protein